MKMATEVEFDGLPILLMNHGLILQMNCMIEGMIDETRV